MLKVKLDQVEIDLTTGIIDSPTVELLRETIARFKFSTFEFAPIKL